jgi:hypothetical protein
MRADIHGGPEHHTLQPEAGYIDARPQPTDRRKPLATHGRTIHWVISGCAGPSAARQVNLNERTLTPRSAPLSFVQKLRLSANSLPLPDQGLTFAARYDGKSLRGSWYVVAGLWVRADSSCVSPRTSIGETGSRTRRPYVLAKCAAHQRQSRDSPDQRQRAGDGEGGVETASCGHDIAGHDWRQ